LAEYGGHIASGAIAAKGKSLGIRAQTFSVLPNPGPHRVGVFDGGWKGVLGGETIVYSDDDDASFLGDATAKTVVRVEVANHPAASMEPT